MRHAVRPFARPMVNLDGGREHEKIWHDGELVGVAKHGEHVNVPSAQCQGFCRSVAKSAHCGWCKCKACSFCAA